MSESAIFLEYQHDCKCDIDFMQQFNKQEVNVFFSIFVSVHSESSELHLYCELNMHLGT